MPTKAQISQALLNDLTKAVGVAPWRVEWLDPHGLEATWAVALNEQQRQAAHDVFQRYRSASPDDAPSLESRRQMIDRLAAHYGIEVADDPDED